MAMESRTVGFRVEVTEQGQGWVSIDLPSQSHALSLWVHLRPLVVELRVTMRMYRIRADGTMRLVRIVYHEEDSLTGAEERFSPL